MHIIITELCTANCELSGKPDVECVRIRLDDTTPEATIATKELLRILRFRQAQQNKLDSVTPAPSRKEPDHDQKLSRPQS